MGSIIYYKDQRQKKWRVQIRHVGFPYTYASFRTEKEAKAFLIKANRIILKAKAKRAVSEALNKLKGGV